jgi:YidC/Oxa1 family membrane protein insertase
MDNRSKLALVLISIIFMGWMYFLQQHPRQPLPQKKTVKEQSSNKEEENKTVASKKVSVFKPVKIDKNLKEKTLTYENEQFNFSFTTRGAAVTSLYYKEKKAQVVVKEKKYKAEGKLDFAIHFNDKEFLEGNDLDSVIWKGVKNEDGVSFFTTILVNKKPLLLQKRFILNSKENKFQVVYSFSNTGREDITISRGRVIISPGDMVGPHLDYSNQYNDLKSIYYTDESYVEEHKGGGFLSILPFSSKPGIVKKKEGKIDYFGIMGRYMLIIMIPKETKGTEYLFDNRTDHGFRSGSAFHLDTIAPGNTITRSFTVYVGEKNKDKLVALNENLKKAADVNMLIQPIRWFVLKVIEFFNSIFGNIGWALVVFALLSKLVFLPLTKKSTESMRKMQELSPQLEALKTKYKDKPEVLQRKMMDMYKENKVNPMGGCFPLLLQMPFFIALYSALISSMDLWNAPFILWMHDMSMPDTVATIAGYNLNILPLLMTVSTFLQQKLTTVDTGQGQQQKMMMYMMPVIMIFIFWTMPSGLVLYWTLSNFFQVGHQLIVNKWGKKDK